MSAAVFAGLVTIVVGASLTWACTGPTFGTPATPANPPAPAAEVPTAPGPGAGAPAGAPPTAPAAVPSPTTSGATTTSGARGGLNTTGRAERGSGSPARGVTGIGRRAAPATPATGVAGSQFRERASGATAGVARSGGQAVFASPAAKPKAAAKSKATARPTPSARSASGDLWNGFEPAARSSVFAAEASAAQQGTGAPMTAALVVLGLGLVGLLGSATVLGLRRRRAEARATAGSSNSTE